MEHNIITSLSGIFSFLAYFGTSIVLTLISIAVYVQITPYKEFELIKKGNVAASISLGGTLIGFAIPVASAIAHSVSIVDMVVWGAVALSVQLFTFFVVRITFPTLLTDIPADKVSIGVFLGTVSLVAGIINAACITY